MKFTMFLAVIALVAGKEMEEKTIFAAALKKSTQQCVPDNSRCSSDRDGQCCPGSTCFRDDTEGNICVHQGHDNHFQCIQKCHMDIPCINKCFANEEEETNTQKKSMVMQVCNDLCENVHPIDHCMNYCKQQAETKKCSLCDNVTCLDNCVMSEDDETMDCKQECGTNDSQNACVIGCKLNPIGCSQICGSDLQCKLRCYRRSAQGSVQDEINTQTEEKPISQIAECPSKCGKDLTCLYFCLYGDEDETNTQMGVCRQACGTDNSQSPCFIGCKLNQIGCSTQCGSDLNCMLSCASEKNFFI